MLTYQLCYKKTSKSSAIRNYVFYFTKSISAFVMISLRFEPIFNGVTGTYRLILSLQILDLKSQLNFGLLKIVGTSSFMFSHILQFSDANSQLASTIRR